MSMDTVDDVEAAEDMLGSFVTAARELLDSRGKNGCPGHREVARVRELLAEYETYCRPTCAGDECDNESCGCPHHNGGTRPYEGS